MNASSSHLFVVPKSEVRGDSIENFRLFLGCLVDFAEINPQSPMEEIRAAIHPIAKELRAVWKGSNLLIPNELLAEEVDCIALGVVQEVNSETQHSDRQKLKPDEFVQLVRQWLNDTAFINPNTPRKILTTRMEDVVSAAMAGLTSKGIMRNNKEEGTEIGHFKTVGNDVHGYLHDLVEGKFGWTYNHLWDLGFSNWTIQTNWDLTRHVWWIVDSTELLAALQKFDYKMGDEIDVPYLDYGVALSTNPIARARKKRDVRHNLPTAKEKHKPRYLILDAYYEAIDVGDIKAGLSIMSFIEKYVKQPDSKIHPNVLPLVRKIRSIDSDELLKVLKKESSDYKGGAAEAIVRMYGQKNRSPSIIGRLSELGGVGRKGLQKVAAMVI